LFVLTEETVEDILNAVVMIVMCGGHVNTFHTNKNLQGYGRKIRNVAPCDCPLVFPS
jgi:hypothetical protein